MKRAIGAVWGIWLLAVFFVFYLVRGSNENALQIVVLAGAVPAALQWLVLGVSTRGLAAPMRVALILMLAILLSYVAAGVDARLAPTTTDGPTLPLNWMPVVFATNTAWAFGLAMIVAGCPERRLIGDAAAVVALLGAPFLVWVVLTGEYTWGRLTAQTLQPNVWGLMGLTVSLCAFAVRPLWLAAPCVVVGVVAIQAASARGSLVALLVAALAVAVLGAREIKRSWVPVLLCVLLAGVAALMFVAPFLPELGQTLSSEVLKLDDPNRGLGQGFTGREAGWIETVQLWQKNPVLGVGFRQHEQLIVSTTSAHNAYLSMLADTGLVGLLAYIYLLVLGTWSAFRIEDTRMRGFAVALMIGYATIGMFERRAINSGNPLGLLFLMGAFYAITAAGLAPRHERAARAALDLPASA